MVADKNFSRVIDLEGKFREEKEGDNLKGRKETTAWTETVFVERVE